MDLQANGASVASALHVRTSAMLLLLISNSLKLRL